MASWEQIQILAPIKIHGAHGSAHGYYPYHPGANSALKVTLGIGTICAPPYGRLIYFKLTDNDFGYSC